MQKVILKILARNIAADMSQNSILDNFNLIIFL